MSLLKNIGLSLLPSGSIVRLRTSKTRYELLKRTNKGKFRVTSFNRFSVYIPTGSVFHNVEKIASVHGKDTITHSVAS